MRLVSPRSLIAASKSLDELKELYRDIHGKVQVYEEENPEAKVRMRANRKLYMNKGEIEQAIMRIEGQRKRTFELWFYSSYTCSSWARRRSGTST